MVKRWNRATNDHAENPAVDAFLAEIAEVCRKHGFEIEHEDSQGGFIIETLGRDEPHIAGEGTSLGRTLPQNSPTTSEPRP